MRFTGIVMFQSDTGEAHMTPRLSDLKLGFFFSLTAVSRAVVFRHLAVPGRKVPQMFRPRPWVYTPILSFSRNETIPEASAGPNTHTCSPCLLSVQTEMIKRLGAFYINIL